MQLPTLSTLLLIFTTGISCAVGVRDSNSQLSSSTSSGTLSSRIPFNPTLLFRREAGGGGGGAGGAENPYDIGMPDPACSEKFKCMENSTKYFMKCDTKDTRTPDGDGSNFYKCLCKEQAYVDLMAACATCYPKPHLATDGFKGTCDFLGVKIKYPSVTADNNKDKNNGATGTVGNSTTNGTATGPSGGEPSSEGSLAVGGRRGLWSSGIVLGVMGVLVGL